MERILSDLAKNAEETLNSAISNMNAALASTPKHLQPFFSELNARLMQAMKDKDQNAVSQVQADIMKFINSERAK